MTLTPLHARALRERRGLDPALAASLGVHSTDQGLAFAYRRRGEIWNVKVRRPDKSFFWTEQGKPLIPFNIDSLVPPPQPGEILVITEGEFDTLAVAQVGFRRVISVPGGAPATSGERSDKRYSWLYAGRDIHPDIAKFETVVLAVDGDDKGKILRDDLAVRIGDDKCFWIEWPEGCKDANDVLKVYGPEDGPVRLRNALLTGRRMWLDFVCKMGDLPDPGPEQVYTVGLGETEADIEVGGIRLPSVGFMTVVGPKGCGKSVLMRQILWHLWRTYGARFLLTALEEAAKPAYQREFRRLAIGRPNKESPLGPPWTLDEVAIADVEIDDAMTIVQRPPLGLLDQEQMLGAVEFAIKVYGVRVVCIDPVNDLDHEMGDEVKTEYLRKFIMRCKQLADQYKILFVCVVHPPSAKAQKKPDALWTLYDAEGSAQWANKSDVGFCIWRPHLVRGETLLHVDKLKRHDVLGKPNLFQLAHNPLLNTFVVEGSGYDLVYKFAADKAAERG